MSTSSLKLRATLSVCLLIGVVSGVNQTATAQNTYTPTPDDRISNRPQNLWKYYMHGCVDTFATPVTLDQLIEPQTDKFRFTRETMNNPYKQYTGKIVSVEGWRNNTITFSKPFLVTDAGMTNRKLRVYFWMKGKNAGMREDVWKAPNIALIFKDDQGKTIKSGHTGFHTVGDFDWHCYYLDAQIHPKTSAIYLQLNNSVRGLAYFSHFSWEWVTQANDFTPNDMQDPVTGSTAPNVYMDELPSHVQSPSGSRYPWHFLKGVSTIPEMTGQKYDIVSLQGLADYFNDHPHTLQPYHRHHSIMYLPGRYYRGSKTQAENGQLLWPDPQPDWIDTFAKLLMAEQDPQTGYWRTMHGLNMGLTFHYANMLFRYYSPRRADRQLRTNPDFQIGLKYIPYANNIIDTTLAMQAHTDEGELAAWNRSAYRYTTDPDGASKQNCDFGTTWDAIYLLRIAEHNPEVDDARKAKVYQAIKAAYGYLLRNNIQPDGAWKLSDTDKYPTSSSYMSGLIEDSHWLEWRIDKSIPSPDVHLKDGLLNATFSHEQHTAIRVFALPKETKLDQLDETHMIGIIQKTGHIAAEMDPYVAVDFIKKAGKAMWGISDEIPDKDDWRYHRYTWWKLRKISKTLIVTTDNHPLKLSDLDVKQYDLYVTAANWYGEQSSPIQIPWP